jgi:outer membrane protein assembly factor BamE
MVRINFTTSHGLHRRMHALATCSGPGASRHHAPAEGKHPMHSFRRIPTIVSAAAALLGLSACANSFLSDGMASITPYKVEIVQGNVVTREQVDKVQPGMSREQVRGLLGAPLLTDMFHGDRWDYVFTVRRKGEMAERRTVVALFEGDKLKKIEAPSDLPSEYAFVAAMPAPKLAKANPKLELSEEERKALPPPAAAEAAASAPTGSTRTYPPLEPAK